MLSALADNVFECDTSGLPLHAITRVCSQCTCSVGMTCYERCWINKPLHAGPSACCSTLCTPGLGFQSLLLTALTLLTTLPAHVQNCCCAIADSRWIPAAWPLNIVLPLIECVGTHRTVSCCRKLSVNHVWTTEQGLNELLNVTTLLKFLQQTRPNQKLQVCEHLKRCL